MNMVSNLALKYPKILFTTVLSLVAVVITLVAVPTLSEKKMPYLQAIHIDTDPENMLAEDEPVRVFHNAMKEKFSLYDMLVVGVINTKHPAGVFNVETLSNIYSLTQYVKEIQWEHEGAQKGVIAAEVISPSTVDNVEQGGLGAVKFEWLMSEPPQSELEALAVAHKAKRIPFLQDTLVSGDQKAIALYIPISSKDVSYDVSQKILNKIAEFNSQEVYHITGLPIAQDQFGVEMFKQMALSAPMAMALIFMLMWLFFRNLGFVVAPMIVAMVSVITTMGLLVITGNTIHIMSSMIPIFIMPIAVLDAVHILSDFFDRYPKTKDCRITIKEVMADLHSPMLFTSLTTAAAFFSLAFTPIPPVQVFGIFIGIGVLLAWILTITLVPAYITLLPEKSLENFGKQHCDVKTTADQTSPSLFDRMLSGIGQFCFRRAKWVIALAVVLIALSLVGIGKIQINDNPVHWFNKAHPIRVADKALNERFAGTYMAYLTLKSNWEPVYTLSDTEIESFDSEIRTFFAEYLGDQHVRTFNKVEIERVIEEILVRQMEAESDSAWAGWGEAMALVGQKLQKEEVFKDPEVLRYIEKLQAHLATNEVVGKSNALPDLVKTVHRELYLGDAKDFRIPDSSGAVAQTLITYQGGHRPQDLWHFVTPDYKETNIWIQLNSGNNKDMQDLIASVEQFFEQENAPIELSHNWFGLTYINVIWQQKMVAGMLESFLGSFVIVLLMMTFLFRSFFWGLLSMVPLTISIAFIYGVIGFIGKDYDMPVAVLSSLSLGLAVDYAIHFLARSRQIYQKHHNWEKALHEIFEEPARAIARNVVVIGMGFTPLLFAPLIPYKTVGVFISAILLLAGLASLFLLPSLITVGKRILFKTTTKE